MKRLIAGFLSVCVAVSLLMTGCSSGGTDNTAQTDGPVTITIWHDKEDEVAQALQTELDTLAPDIVVKLEKKDGLTDSLKMVGNDPNSAPDMYFFAHDKIGVYAEMGILAPITDFVDKSTLDQYIPMTIEAATYKGEVYQLPIYFETLLYMYNRRYMSDDEVPSTTEELYKYMQENTKGGHYGFVEQHSTAYYAAGWLHAFGGYILNENGEPGLDDENTIKALEYHKKFVELMPTEGEYSTVNTLFREGKAHSTIGGPWLVPTARESGIDLGIAPMPTVDETGNKIAPYSGVQGIHVLKVAAERKHDAIVKVLQVLTNDSVGIAMAKASGTECLKKSGYTNLIMTMNGQEAWDKLTEFKKKGTVRQDVHCIITDIEMPLMDGHRLTKLCKSDDEIKKIPLIIFSSLVNEEMRKKGEQLGADAQMTKPEIGMLVEAIDNLIDKSVD